MGRCKLVLSGCQGVDTGLADWSRIREIVEYVDVPVIANGNIQVSVIVSMYTMLTISLYHLTFAVLS